MEKNMYALFTQIDFLATEKFRKIRWKLKEKYWKKKQQIYFIENI